ncbi:hypothetical protein DY000_02042751 [Brassica cretica]|uniref:Uncharacterized protein n=1 Tax=Brassica cretica TaxID=69181 RepID=A0ABQ7BND7_BRACR|nr:hypothetical protein DY000_02042751 [Brassica cretica]
MRRTKQRRLNVDYKRRRIILDACKPNPACAFYTPIRLSGRRHNPSLHLQRRTSYGPTPLIIIGPGRRNRLWSPPRRQPPPHWLYPCLVSPDYTYKFGECTCCSILCRDQFMFACVWVNHMHE